MNMLADILMIVGGALTGVIAALTVIAPRLKGEARTVANEVLADAEEAKKVLDVVTEVLPATPAPTPPAPQK